MMAAAAAGMLAGLGARLPTKSSILNSKFKNYLKAPFSLSKIDSHFMSSISKTKL